MHSYISKNKHIFKKSTNFNYCLSFRHHLSTSKSINNENMIDYNAFLKYFQDRSEASFLAHALNTFNKDK